MVGLERFIDKYMGYIALPLLYPFRLFDKEPQKIKKILIIKLWALGDSILTLPLIKALKIKYAGAEIDVLIRKRVAPAYESYNGVHKIIYLKDALFSAKKYDLVFDCEPYLNISAILSLYLGKRRIGFAGQWRSMLYNKTVKFRKDQHMVQNYLDMLRVLGFKYDTKKLEKLIIGAKEKKNIDRFLFGKKKPLIGITPGVAETVKSRMWFEERFAELADKMISEFGAEVIFIDGPSNKEVVDKIIGMMKEKPINACGKFSLKETFYLISKCNVFISNDTGPMHIAAAMGVKTIGLFGPNTPVLWAPYGKGNVAIYKTKLAPSIQNDKGTFEDRDREGYMGPITVEDVFNEVAKLL